MKSRKVSNADVIEVVTSFGPQSRPQTVYVSVVLALELAVSLPASTNPDTDLSKALAEKFNLDETAAVYLMTQLVYRKQLLQRYSTWKLT